MHCPARKMMNVNTPQMNEGPPRYTSSSRFAHLECFIAHSERIQMTTFPTIFGASVGKPIHTVAQAWYSSGSIIELWQAYEYQRTVKNSNFLPHF